MLNMLNRYREELSVSALAAELSANAQATQNFLQSESAAVSIEDVAVEGGRLEAQVVVRNKDGHKLPTAYPSRRAWLHFVVRARNGQIIFESGALKPDGSISGNDNDADPSKYEPHYSEIDSTDQVEIYESILGDQNGRVTTGLLSGVRYLKDNRLLPKGFDKQTADDEIAVVGKALSDSGFTGGGHRIHYSAALGTAIGPFTVEAELWYQPIGYRWANNLKPYSARADESRRFTGYFDSMQSETAIALARTMVTTGLRP
jgi:hypothetical protein